MQPFIMNHQYNFIQKQTSTMKYNARIAADFKVIDAVRYSAETNIDALFPFATEEQKLVFGNVSKLREEEDFQAYLSGIANHLVEFPRVNESQLKKLFPKNKKLKLPDLTVIDFHRLTYLGWIDIATNKWFLVYPYFGETIGIEGRFTLTGKKGVCSLCNHVEEIALVTAKTKRKPSQSTDNYKSVGNYMCVDSHKCNENLTDPAYLERFIQNVRE